MGTINLVATAKYYPLRFHVVTIMNQLSAGSGVYIPQLPFLLEVGGIACCFYLLSEVEGIQRN